MLTDEILKLVEDNYEASKNMREDVRYETERLMCVSDRCVLNIYLESKERLESMLGGGTEYDSGLLAIKFSKKRKEIKEAVETLESLHKIRIEVGEYSTFMYPYDKPWLIEQC